MRTRLTVRMELCSDAIFSSGLSVPGGEDIALRLTPDGYLVFPGSTLKGLLRECTQDLLRWQGDAPALAGLLYGESGRNDTDDSRRLLFGDLCLDKKASGVSTSEDCFALRAFTQMENGIVKDGSLRTAACLRKGLVFTGELYCDEADAALVGESLRALKFAGLMRSRGLGRVLLTAAASERVGTGRTVSAAEWLHYRLRLKTPLSVPWLTRSGAAGEKLNDIKTRAYVPGSAVRGMVASRWAQDDPAGFEAVKSELLGDGTRFLDALPAMPNGKPTIPTPMGYYEDKKQTRFYSVLSGDVQGNDKRAKLGAFCTVENGVLKTASPAIEHSIRIERTERNIFTVDRISANTVLDGYVHLKNPALAPKIAAYFGEVVTLGADRYAGSGLCAVETLETTAPPWLSLSLAESAAEGAPTETTDMLLLSPMGMQRGGEPCGLDEEALAAALGVQSVQIVRCATSLTERTGYNRKWGCRVPELPMYEQGSVFRLRCTPAPKPEALRRAEREGLGLCRAEGCGQVLFLPCGAELRREPPKTAELPCRSTPADRLRRKRCAWLLQTELRGSLSASQLGELQAQCEYSIQSQDNAAAVIAYLEHNTEGRDPQQSKRYRPLKEQVEKILEEPLSVTLGTEVPCEDSVTERLRLLCDLFDLSRKEGSRK